MSGKVRVVHAGLGYWGPNILRNLTSHPDVELLGVCDSRADIREATSKRLNTKPYADLADVMADPQVDAVTLATPSALHPQQTLALLQAGKHVMVEKPIAESTREAVEIAQLADRTGLVCLVGHVFRYNNIVDTVKDYIRQGSLGEVYYVYSQRLNLGRFRSDSDVMWTLAPHDVSIINHWFDAQPVSVSARGLTLVHPGSGLAEVCYAFLKYPDGRSAHLHLSWLDPQKRREMVVVGSDKMLVYDDANVDAHIQLYDKSAQAEHQTAISSFADFGTRLRAGDLIIPNVKLKEPLGREVDAFIQAIRAGTQPATNAWHAAEVTAVLEALAQSMRQGGADVDVQWDALRS